MGVVEKCISVCQWRIVCCCVVYGGFWEEGESDEQISS